MRDLLARKMPPTTKPSSHNETCSVQAAPCQDGMLLPVWTTTLISDKEKAVLYLLAMLYMFLGVSFFCDTFMSSIEVITSQERDTIVVLPNGTKTIVRVRIWNETVANLTLMALGSSAPEILLSVIEICGRGFDAGQLGPSTIVGSAAYNLFIISAICIYTVPTGETRYIRYLRVFFVTAAWSIFAYIWMCVILVVTSKGVVEVWEAALTLMFFPLTVITAYMADRKCLCFRYLSRRFSKKTDKNEKHSADAPPLSGDKLRNVLPGKKRVSALFPELLAVKHQSIPEYERQKREVVEILQELREQYPYLDIETLVAMARNELFISRPKSKAFYRSSYKRLQGRSEHMLKEIDSSHNISLDMELDETSYVFFNAPLYAVLESAGEFEVAVAREGGDMSQACLVDYETMNGTAEAGVGYWEAKGTVTLNPFQRYAKIGLAIIDDEKYKVDQFFFVRLFNLRPKNQKRGQASLKLKLGETSKAKVIIIDNDHPGVFSFKFAKSDVSEDVGDMKITVTRAKGGRGKVVVPYRAMDGTARADVNYRVQGKKVVFENDEYEKLITVHIINDDQYSKSLHFTVALAMPIMAQEENRLDEAASSVTGTSVVSPTLGQITKHQVFIRESEFFKTAVDRVLTSKMSETVLDRKASWTDKFDQALIVEATMTDDVDGDLQLPTFCDYTLHFVTLTWKLLNALIPPVEWCHGWISFFVSILFIGYATTIIADLASNFGCSLGLKDSFTAISIVAVGTSIPDTFASKLAVLHERYADSAIGNITGSNAVNVFLGLGLAWTIAAIYHAYNGTSFRVDPGDLVLSVLVYSLMSFLAVAILLGRRYSRVGGELGGPVCLRVVTVFTLCMFWLLYLLVATLVMYCMVRPWP